jgi:hypothetical protein
MSVRNEWDEAFSQIQEDMVKVIASVELRKTISSPFILLMELKNSGVITDDAMCALFDKYDLTDMLPECHQNKNIKANLSPFEKAIKQVPPEILIKIAKEELKMTLSHPLVILFKLKTRGFNTDEALCGLFIKHGLEDLCPK